MNLLPPSKNWVKGLTYALQSSHLTIGLVGPKLATGNSSCVKRHGKGLIIAIVGTLLDFCYFFVEGKTSVENLTANFDEL